MGLFDDAEIIHSYSRAQAIEDGVLVDVTEVATEAGFKIPVAMTREVFEDCVAWTEADDKRKPEYLGQSDAGRLWDLVWMASMAARRNRDRDRVTFQVLRIPREGRGLLPRLTTLHLHVGPGDTAAPVITIMQPGQD